MKYCGISPSMGIKEEEFDFVSGVNEMNLSVQGDGVG